MQGNPFVEFMRTYGPSASSDSLYDEHVQSALRKYDVTAIELSAPLVDKLGEHFTAPDATNVILTGTAGDGKTYHIRRVFVEYLGGTEKDWPGDDLVLQLFLPDGRQLRIIRDLSELPKETKSAEIKHITRCLAGQDPHTVYLIAANDGQLLEMWRTATVDDHEQVLVDRVHDALATMLQQETKTDPTKFLHIRMFNLSRRREPSIMNEAIEKILEHPMWESGCENCPLTSKEQSCAIQINRKLLLGQRGNDNKNLFRSRLSDLLELASANDQHIPVRQILTLIVNIVLGDSKNHDDPLLTCETARMYASKGSYTSTNPYDNAFGKNISEDVRGRYVVFSTLEMFGIGFETTNEFDDLLLHKKPESPARSLEDVDPIYGGSIFQVFRNSYVNGPRERMNLKGFSQAMISQRRRLFFQVPLECRSLESSHWLLTVFHRGQDYLNYRDAVQEGGPRNVMDRIGRQLVKGLNRALTGMMTDDTEKLWLASMIGKSDDPTGRVSVTPAIDRTGVMGMIHLQVNYSQTRTWPELRLRLPFTSKAFPKSTVLELRPQIFEYLLRVADGSLPSSFSRQCHQEVKHFATILRQSVQRVLDQNGPTLDSIRVLSLDEDASIKSNPIRVNSS